MDMNSAVDTVMSLFANKPNKIVKNNHFWVFIGLLKLSFTKVSGFEQDVDKEDFVEGGMNDACIEMVVPKKARRTLKFERGIQTINPAVMAMRPGVAIPLGITVLMMNDKNIPIYCYHVNDCVVTKWEVSDFDANTAAVVIDTFEISYSTCEHVNLQLF